MLEKIVSGGQTGVDRAALDVALRRGFPCGGWCPRGRRAEDGRLLAIYPLRECASPLYAERTRLNVRDSDGTLVLFVGKPEGGTALTIAYARIEGHPCLALEVSAESRPRPILEWLEAHDIRVLNVAGPRESSVPGIYAMASALLDALLVEIT